MIGDIIRQVHSENTVGVTKTRKTLVMLYLDILVLFLTFPSIYNIREPVGRYESYLTKESFALENYLLEAVNCLHHLALEL